MSVHEPSTLLPPSHSPPNREQSTSLSNPLGNAPVANPQPVKPPSEKKAPKKKLATNAGSPKQTGAPSSRRDKRRYEPYRKPDPTPELEGNLQADPDELEALDATAKMLYKSDREVLEYIELIRQRTAAVLEHVNRNGSQLRACRGAMERIESFVGQWQAIGDRWTAEQIEEDSDEEDDDDDDDDDEEDGGEDEAPRNPDLLPTMVSGGSGTIRTIEERLLSNLDNPDFPYTYARDVLGDSASQPPSGHAEALPREGTHTTGQPLLPPVHEDRNDLEYAEDNMEVRSDFPVPPDHAGLASDDSTFNRSGVDLRIASDTGMLFPPSENELARISRGFKREASMGTSTAITPRPLASPFRSHHPLMQSYVPSSPPEPTPQLEPRHLVTPRPVLRTPSPSRTIYCRKRKRAPASSDEDEDTGNIVGPSATIVRHNSIVPDQVDTKVKNDGVPTKRRRLASQQPTWDSPFVEAGYVPQPPCTGPQIHEGPSEPLPRVEHEQFSLPPVRTPRVQKEDSESERSEVVEMLGQAVEQGEPHDEEQLPGVGRPQNFLPDLTADNSQSTSADNTRPEIETPAESQLLPGIPTDAPLDVFGPIILSVKANEITEKLPARYFHSEGDADAAIPNSADEGSKISSKSARFSLAGSDDEKEHKVFRKTPVRPRRSLRTVEAESVFAAEVESLDTVNPLPSPKKKRTTGARVRKTKAASVELGPTTNPGGDLSAISASEPPVLRRGRSASIQIKVAALPKAPGRKPTRSRK